MMWISANLSLFLKGRTKDYRGMTQENWSFGKDKPINLSILVLVIAKTIIEFYAKTHKFDADYLNKEIAKASELLADLHVEQGA